MATGFFQLRLLIRSSFLTLVTDDIGSVFFSFVLFDKTAGMQDIG